MMDWQTVVAIISLCVTAVITVLGWSAAHYYATKRDDRTRQIEFQIERCDQQIEGFYGPLYTLLRQLINISILMSEIGKKGGLPPEQLVKVQEYINEHFYFPLHDETLKILRARIHLVPEVPEIFWIYLKYITHERIRNELAVHTGVSAQIDWEPWPYNLWGDLEAGLKQAFAHQEELLQARVSHQKSGKEGRKSSQACRLQEEY